MTRIILPILILLACGAPALSQEINVGNGLVLAFTAPGGWTVHTEAPPALVEMTAELLAHEAAAAGKQPGHDQLRQAARARLAANEGYLYHAASGSHLDIDFSPLEPGEQPPSAASLRKSAEYALQSLANEAGVSLVDSAIRAVKVVGAQQAYRLDATYRNFTGHAQFTGIIGAADRHWFFLYFTAPGAPPDALEDFARLFDTLLIKPAQRP